LPLLFRRTKTKNRAHSRKLLVSNLNNFDPSTSIISISDKERVALRESHFNIESKIPGNQELSGLRLIEHTLIYRQTESKADNFSCVEIPDHQESGRICVQA